jgi:hypothetical protein
VAAPRRLERPLPRSGRQRYPGDFDSILAAEPANYWSRYVVAELWPQIAMREAGFYSSACELAAVGAAAGRVRQVVKGWFRLL